MNLKKIGLTILFIIIAFVLTAAILNFMVVNSSRPNLYDITEIGQEEMIFEDQSNLADCILVLGAGIYADGTPSTMLRDRLDRGIQLYELGLAPKLLLSGDNGQEYYNEVEAMRKYVVSSGVPAEDIFLDHAGFSTYDSLHRAKSIFEAKKVIVVTQLYHEFRAIYIGKKMGLDVIGVHAERISYSGDVAREIREVIARNKDFLKCIIKPSPTFLGDTIDLKGDGQITWE